MHEAIGTEPEVDGTSDATPEVTPEVEALQAELRQLRTALSRRPVIDMAKGAVMAFSRCDEDTAFATLSEVSQTHNVKLYDLASALLADLPAGAEGLGGRAGDLVARNWTRRGR